MEQQVLLDDSRRFVEHAVAAGVDAELDVWEGMVHGFLGGIGRLAASTEAHDLIGSFLTKCFTKLRNSTQLKPTQKRVFGSRKCREYFLD